MPFKKGMKKHPLSGKKIGSTHPVTYVKARDLIIKRCANPVEEILNLIPLIEPKDQIKAWFEILTWLEPKPKNEIESEHYSASMELRLSGYTDDELDELIRTKVKILND